MRYECGLDMLKESVFVYALNKEDAIFSPRALAGVSR